MCLEFLERRKNHFELMKRVDSPSPTDPCTPEQAKLIKQMFPPLSLCTEISDSFKNKFSSIDWQAHYHFTLPAILIGVTLIALIALGVYGMLQKYEDSLSQRVLPIQGIKL